MALSFAEVKNLIDGNIGTLTSVVISADSSNRGASGTTNTGLVIKRNGQVTGSLSSGQITLEGGGINWEGALTQSNAAPYFTRAQRTMLASLMEYIGSMSNATIDDQVNQR